jgi:hypothetical protein
MASFTTDQIQHAIDEACSELKEWKAVIPFCLCDVGKSYDDDNIMRFVSNQWKNTKIYFPPDKYPVNMVDPFDKTSSWKMLKQDLERAALNNGFNLISNGGHAAKKTNLGLTVKIPEPRMICSYSKKYIKPFKSRTNTNEQIFHSTSLHNDCCNTRGKLGSMMPRRTKTMKPLTCKAACRM